MTKACVIGWPVEHSRSPLIHGYWLKTYGIDGHYGKVAVREDELDAFLRALPASGYAGCNVTVPHKEAVLRAADEVLPAAQAVGAANTLWLEGDRLFATNTDTIGYMAYLNEKAPGWMDGGRPVAVLGAGGAARAVVFGLLQAGVKEVHIVNRSQSRAQALCRHFGPGLSAVGWKDLQKAAGEAGLIINTTSLGMNGKGQIDIDFGGVAPEAVVSDIVYVPLETGFLRAARAAGLRTVDGLGMLLHQAVPGFEKWFGVRPTVTEELYQIVAEDVRASQC